MAEISDFMPVEDAGQAQTSCVGKDRSRRDPVPHAVRPAFDYARATHTVDRRGTGRSLAVAPARASWSCGLLVHSPMQLRTATPSPSSPSARTRPPGSSSRSRTRTSHPRLDSRTTRARRSSRTVNFWRDWIGRCTYKGRWRETVNRSALTLKLLTSRPPARSSRRRLRASRGHRRRAQLGLPLHLDPRRLLHHLRPMRLGYTAEAAAFING